ncbi:MAG: Adenosylmethionine-8-amino-7-oxononanoate aminotransferase [uncultured bacterium]|nr:MAG: Adenosylmethionine-8-amino-7-oxononanoate aminotransferase [uncultured bacterium]
MSIFRVFPNEPVPPYVEKGDGIYVYTRDGKKYLDTTGGSTSYAILGWNHPKVNSAITDQLKRFTHMDYKVWSDANTEALAELLLSRAEHKLNRVYFSGNSGAEACEAAMKMSYQVHHDTGHPEKTWFISREQSYHGATTDAMALGDRPNLSFYQPILPLNRDKISQHHPKLMMHEGESLDDYAKRSAKELEDKILEIGPEKVAGFIGETIMGGLVGDVPPAPNYWKYIREVCNKYDVHLILDEVFCGTGTSGKIYCCDWDGVTPDFIFIGKTLAAGYAPISVVITSDKVESIIKSVQGRLQHTTTHQAYSLGIAAALAVQKIIHEDEFLSHVNELGNYIRSTLQNELGNHPYFFDIRGRGMRFSLEYRCSSQHEFGQMLEKKMREEHQILISGKWHRVCFSPALITTKTEANYVLSSFIDTFKKVGEQWMAN